MKKKELEERKTERVDYSAEMTNEEYRDIIIEIVKRIDDKKFLNLIHNFIVSAMKKWL